MNILPMALVLVLLTGCATTPKPELSNEDYQKYSRIWAATHFCNNKGWVSPDVAATGVRFIRANLASYTTDAARFDREVAWYASNNTTPTQADCNQLAMAIQDRKQQIDINNYNVEANQRATQELINSNRIKNTYCNKIGSQTFCNTY